MNQLSNNTASPSFGTYAYSVCIDTEDLCQALTGNILRSLSPLIYTSWGLGGLYVVHGVIQLTDLGVDAIAFLVDKVKKKYFRKNDLLIEPKYSINEDRSEQTGTSSWKGFVKNWKRVFTVGKAVGIATLCIFSSCQLYFFFNSLKTRCERQPHTCYHFQAEAVEGCDWVNQFLIDVIRQILLNAR